jgi:RimJ/RimL family protein N-acetyltransferase
MTVRTTERLLLRAPTDADLDAVFSIYGDPATQVFNPFGPMNNREAAGHLLWRWQLHRMRHGFGMWVVCRRDNPKEVLGFGGVQWGDASDAVALRVHLRADASGWGFGTEIGHAALLLAESLPVPVLVRALVSPGHRVALRWLGKLGFAVAGTRHLLPWMPAQQVFEQQLPLRQAGGKALGRILPMGLPAKEALAA